MATKPDDVCIFCLLYGDFFDLHSRILNGLKASLPPEVKVICWCNQVCHQTTELLDKHGFEYHENTTNYPKYKVMRELFALVADKPYVWYVWFDDDTNIVDRDWFTKTLYWLDETETISSVYYAGQEWSIKHAVGQQQFIKSSPWYKNREFQITKNGKTGVRFAQGSYWWLRSSLVKELDWPDKRLSHNGGDTLLAEAIHQLRKPFTKMPRHCFGVVPNAAPRRGMAEAPAGCLDPNFRR